MIYAVILIAVSAITPIFSLMISALVLRARRGGFFSSQTHSHLINVFCFFTAPPVSTANHPDPFICVSVWRNIEIRMWSWGDLPCGVINESINRWVSGYVTSVCLAWKVKCGLGIKNHTCSELVLDIKKTQNQIIFLKRKYHNKIATNWSLRSELKVIREK